jgi:hypothetical protein
MSLGRHGGSTRRSSNRGMSGVANVGRRPRGFFFVRTTPPALPSGFFFLRPGKGLCAGSMGGIWGPGDPERPLKRTSTPVEGEFPTQSWVRVG